MNRVILIGNLASDPEFRTTASGIAQCTFRLAVQRRYANQQGVRETDFFPIVCWRQTAELCNRYLAKGRKAGVEGNIQTRSYDAQDGSKRYVTEIIAENVEFLTPRDDASRQGGYYSAPPSEDAPYASTSAAVPSEDGFARRQKAPGNDVFTSDTDDGCPF